MLHTFWQTLRQAAASGRVGTHVFARVWIQTAAATSETPAALFQAASELADQWHTQPQRVFALATPQRREWTVHLAFASGATALLSVAAGDGPPRVEGMLAGTRGVCQWESDGCGAWCGDPPGDARKSDADLAAAIQAALDGGQAVSCQAGQWRTEEDRPLADRLPAEVRHLALSPEPPGRPPYGVLLVAGGHTHQEMYGADFQSDPRCRVVGLADAAGIPPRRHALNERLARRLGVPLLPDLTAALRRPEVQLVSICAEPERRADLIVQCARAGKHLYLDKPLCASSAEAARIVAAVAEARVYSQMFSQVAWPFARRLRDAMNPQAAGPLEALHFDLLFAKGTPGTAVPGLRREHPQPRQFERPQAKRELYNVGVYPLALVEVLLRRRVRRVYAATANYFFAEHQAADMEDFGSIVLQLDDGTIGTVVAGRTGWRSHPAAGMNRAGLVGRHRAVWFDAFRPRLAMWCDEPAWEPPPRHPDDPLFFWSTTQQEAGTSAKKAWLAPSGGAASDPVAFVDCLEQGRAPEMDAAAAGRVTEVLMAAYQSAADGCAVCFE